MKTFLSSAWVHVIVVFIFTAGTQWLTANAYNSITVGTVVHALYEWYLSFSA